LLLERCLLEGNYVSDTDGGALYAYRMASITARDTVFRGNSAAGGMGGAIGFASLVGALTLQGCTLQGNTADR